MPQGSVPLASGGLGGEGNKKQLIPYLDPIVNGLWTIDAEIKKEGLQLVFVSAMNLMVELSKCLQEGLYSSVNHFGITHLNMPIPTCYSGTRHTWLMASLTSNYVSMLYLIPRWISSPIILLDKCKCWGCIILSLFWRQVQVLHKYLNESWATFIIP